MPTGLLLLLAVSHFAAFADRALPAVYAPRLKADFGLSDGQLGLLLGPAFVIVYVMGALAVGARRRPLDFAMVLSGCVAAWTVGSIIFALSASYEVLLASRVILGTAQAAFAPCALVLIARSVPRDRLSRATAVFTSGSATGRSGGLILGGAALAVLSSAVAAPHLTMEPWRVAVIVLTLPNLLLALFLYRALRRGGFAKATPGDGLGPAWRWLMKHKSGLGLHFLAVSAVIVMVQAAAAWAPSVLHRNLGLGTASAGLLAGAVVLVSAPMGHLGAGWLLDRRMIAGAGPIGVLAPGVGLAVVGAVVLYLAVDPIGAAIGLALITAGGGGAGLAGLAGLHPLTPDHMRGGVTSLYMAWVAGLGVSGGPWLTGALSDALGDQPRALSLALLAIMAAAGALAVLLASLGARAWLALKAQVERS